MRMRFHSINKAIKALKVCAKGDAREEYRLSNVHVKTLSFMVVIMASTGIISMQSELFGTIVYVPSLVVM